MAIPLILVKLVIVALTYTETRVLSQITEDHSLVQEQLSAGLITEEQAKFSMVRNIITRSIGFENSVEVDIFRVPLRIGDHFLLCSDGLTGLVDMTKFKILLRRLLVTKYRRR